MTLPVPFASWSSWKGLPLQLSREVLALVLDDGQAFRWHALPDATWLGFWDRWVLRLTLDSENRLQWSSPHTALPSVEAALNDYLALNTGFPGITDRLPWRSDPHLARCLAAFPGLRLLRQPFGETLLCFLCSSTKQIPQIKQMTEMLASRLGETVLAKPPKLPISTPLSFHRLPTWEELTLCSEASLRSCALGFRARYVKDTATFLSKHPGWLKETEGLPYAAAHARLCELPGVGSKIADCVLLYGGGKLDAFPTDTWILKVMARRYGLEAWKPDAVSRFGRAHFGAAAGLAQQYLFNYERAELP